MATGAVRRTMDEILTPCDYRRIGTDLKSREGIVELFVPIGLDINNKHNNSENNKHQYSHQDLLNHLEYRLGEGVLNVDVSCLTYK
jgi:hypothetical protein